MTENKLAEIISKLPKDKDGAIRYEDLVKALENNRVRKLRCAVVKVERPSDEKLPPIKYDSTENLLKRYENLAIRKSSLKKGMDLIDLKMSMIRKEISRRTEC